MGDQIRVETNIEELQKKLLRWSRVAPQELRKALTRSSMFIAREVKSAHLSGPKMQRGMGHPTMATLAVRTGRLRRSITQRVAVEPGRYSAIIGTNVPYGRKHEFGQGVPFRPFLRPSLEKKRPEALEMLNEALMKSYGK